MKAQTWDAYRLFHDGVKALAIVEANGMRIDTDRLDRTIKDVEEEIESLQEKQRQSDVWKDWKKAFGSKTSMGSRQQLAHVLFKERGHKCLERTEKTDRPKTDEVALKALGVPFVDDFLQIEKLKKLKSTYLMGVRREVVNGLLHAFFNLHLVRTFRSSSANPNFQNIPIRDPEVGKLIRSCFIPRDDHFLVEVDFSALEVRVAACYHKDPVMIRYIKEGYDLHTDMATLCYRVPKELMTKEIRYCAKNRFVFPQFYGDWFESCANELWSAISRMGLKLSDGTEMKEHLRSVGIEGLGDFVDNIKDTEQELWTRFEKYARWKEYWVAKYLQTGSYLMKTGFRVSGVYGRNDVLNGAIQGSAFHCLLWSLIELVKWMRKKKLKSKVVGQIHDSLVMDVHKSEFDDVISKTVDVMTKDLLATWDWIIVPLEVEAECSETNWFEKKEVKL